MTSLIETNEPQAAKAAIEARKVYLLQTIAGGSRELERLTGNITALSGSIQRCVAELQELNNTEVKFSP
jgi:hypothetical protein